MSPSKLTPCDVVELTPWCFCLLLLPITVFSSSMVPKLDTTHELTFWQLQVDVKLLQACESVTVVCFCGMHNVPLYAVTPGRQSKRLCRPARSVRVSCDCGCALCCGAVRFGKVGSCLPNGCITSERRW